MNQQLPEPGRAAETPLGAKATEVLRKFVAGGLNTAVTTEEGIRGILGDLRLPKEAISFLATQTDKTKREFFRALKGEMKEFLGDLDLGKEVRRALVGLRIEVNGSIRIKEEEGGSPLPSTVPDQSGPEEGTSGEKPA